MTLNKPLRPHIELCLSLLTPPNTSQFFNDRGFNYIHTPLITAADCEGAGEQFCVTTMLPEHGKAAATLPATTAGDIDYSKDFFGKRACLTVRYVRNTYVVPDAGEAM